MRIRLALLAVAAVLSVAAPVPATASCTGPLLQKAGRLVPARDLVVTGVGFMDGCDDTGQGGGSTLGCRGTSGVRDSEERPYDDVRLVLTQGARTWDLGTVDAGPGGSVRWVVTVPAEVAAGPAVLGAASAELAVVVG